MPEKPKLKLVKTSYGYWTYEPKPTQEELSDYYAKKYYQQGRASYELRYSGEEVSYFRLKASLIFRQLRLILGKKFCSLLDLGCGEGWLLDKFHKEGLRVRGIDFSAFALNRFHPHLKPYFEQGDIYKLLEKEMSAGHKYDVIAAANVLEHLTDPIGLLDGLKRLLSKDGVLVIVVPNDFSNLHEHLLRERFIDRAFWLAFPEHLSYFNKMSMEKLLADRGFKLEAVVADNAIDFNLMNSNTNYIRNPGKGKETHRFRVRADNFLASISEEKLLDLYKILGSMGIGRDLNYYCSIER
jgi:2-polyprenyl-3-methyl-5-hydroxy-6-metoxy-1,4-benzoquinol methylase